MNKIIELQISNATLFSLSMYRFGDTVQGDMDEIETSANKDLMKLHKRLFAIRDAKGNLVECPQWKKAKSVFGKLNMEIAKRSTPIFTYNNGSRRLRRGLRLINLDCIKDIEALIKGYETQMITALDEFAVVYESLKDIAKQELNGQFNADDYPSIEYIRSRFGISWSYLPFGLPPNLPKEVLEREMAITIANNKATAEECRLALRTGLLSLVEHLQAVLKPDTETGKKKRFFESNLDKIVEFQNLLKFTDMTGDTELADMAQKARALVDGAVAKDIRKGNMVDEMVKGAEEIAVTLRTMVGEVKGRKFNFDE
jgi:hypothetical protein